MPTGTENRLYEQRGRDITSPQAQASFREWQREHNLMPPVGEQHIPKEQTSPWGRIPRLTTEPLPGRLMEMLRRSTALPEHPDNKPQKPSSITVPVPEKFSGSNPNMDELKAWVDTVTRYFCLSHIDINNTTMLRDWIPMLLTGEAADWLQDTVTYGGNLEEWDIHWITEGLKNCFITQESLLTSANSFDAVKQNGKQVLEMYNELEKFARQMVEHPTDYAFRRRFMDGLDNHISVAMICVRTSS